MSILKKGGGIRSSTSCDHRGSNRGTTLQPLDGRWDRRFRIGPSKTLKYLKAEGDACA